MRIAFFDSGIGGISVLNEALTKLPGESFLYYADTLHVPYGTKSKEEVKQCIFEAVQFILRQEVKALVIACNTATSIAVEDLRRAYSIPIIGMEPAIKPAIEQHPRKRVIVMATPLTLKQDKFHSLTARVDPHHYTDHLALPELVQMCERLEFDERTAVPYFKEKLAPFDLNDTGAIVLGCTHFPFYRRILRTIVPEHIEIVDGNEGTVNRLIHVLEESGPLHARSEEAAAADRIEFHSSRQSPDELDRMLRALTYIRSMGSR